MISQLEKEVTLRFLKTRKNDGFLNIISIFSFIGISLGVAVLIIVMSVMNGFRTELIDKIVGFNSHAVVKPYDNSITLDSYKKIAKTLDQSIIDSISIEDAHRYNDLSLLKDYTNTKIILGVIKIASSNLESIEEIELRINEALKYIAADQLIAAPDCGLGHLSRDLAIAKLKKMVQAVKKFNK